MVDDLANLDRRITDALGALRRARAAAEGSADRTARWRAEMAERLLDDLLEQRPRRALVEAGTPAGTAPGHRAGR